MVTSGVPRASLGHALRKARICITAGLVLSVALNVLLAHRVRTLIREQSARIVEQRLKIGASVAQIQAKRLGGQQEVVAYAGVPQPTVLYVFTPSCSWCARNMDNLKTLLDKKRSDYRFVGVSLSDQGLVEYVVKNDLKLPVYSGLTPETLMAYKLGSTPQTIIVSPEGKVLQNWRGAYVGDIKSQVEEFFHVTLPGLKELPKEEKGKAAQVN